MGKLIKIENKLLSKRRKQKSQPKVGCIIQARMTSKRFPGKSIALLNGKPVIEHVFNRAKQLKGVRVVVAVPDSDASEPILNIADDMNVENFLGSENNVLKRYYDAAKFFGFEHIVRITGDCPFIDPIVCMDVINLYFFRNLDYCSNIFPTRTYPQGLDCEVFSMDCLEAAKIHANSPYELEHVTPWMQQTDGIRRACVQQRIDKSKENWCVDYPEDIKRLEDLCIGKKDGQSKEVEN